MSRHHLLALTCALLAAGCSHPPPPTPQARLQSAFDDARGEVRSLIPDKARAARADALLVELQQVFERASTQSEALQAQVDELDRRQDATEAQFRAVLAAGDDERAHRRRAVASIREQLARLLTREEWLKVDAARRRLLELHLGPQPL